MNTESSATQAMNPLRAEQEFRQEVIYFIIVDRFCDGTSDSEERAGIWDRGDKEGLLDKTWMEWGK